jgi:hypothetical protein
MLALIQSVHLNYHNILCYNASIAGFSISALKCSAVLSDTADLEEFIFVIKRWIGNKNTKPEHYFVLVWSVKMFVPY